MDLVWIHPGEFMMGSPRSEAGRIRWEGPRHRVTITKGFWMGKYEVTQAQYQAVTGVNPSHFRGPRQPVERVSWYDAVEFCRQLSARSGRIVRLPTEAEWEYACRAATITPFCFGASLSSEQANFDGEYPCGDAPKAVSRNQTTNVGSFAPNAWGLYDMHGNVSEWCADYRHMFFGVSYPRRPQTDPVGPPSGRHRAVRGGNAFSQAAFCRSASRGTSKPLTYLEAWGFRVVVVGAE
jgi:formylglycine-generating enzyme required for sulfatase activity